jgi:hypothetical protein
VSASPHPQPGVELGLLLPTSEPTVFDDPDGEAQLDAYCRTTYGMASSVVRAIQLIVVGPAAELADALSRYVDAGARHLVVRVGCLDTGDQPERIAAALDPLRARATPAALTPGP